MFQYRISTFSTQFLAIKGNNSDNSPRLDTPFNINNNIRLMMSVEKNIKIKGRKRKKLQPV